MTDSKPSALGCQQCKEVATTGNDCLKLLLKRRRQDFDYLVPVSSLRNHLGKLCQSARINPVGFYEISHCLRPPRACRGFAIATA